MDIKHLSWFIETVKEKSINKAAEKLFITPSALSARLVKIEDEVGCQLLTRSHHGIALTPEGQYFFEDACKICELQANWAYLNQRQRAMKENISIAAFPSVYNTVIPKLVANLTSENSPYDIFSYQYDVLQIETAFYRNEIAIGITGINQNSFSSVDAFAKNLNLRLCILGSDQFGVYVSEKHPLSNRTSVKMEEPSEFLNVTSFDAAFKKMGLHRFNAGCAINIRGQQNQLAYISAHPTLCFGIYPSLLQKGIVSRAEHLCYIPIEGNPLPITYVLLYAPSAISSDASQLIITELKNIFYDYLYVTNNT